MNFENRIDAMIFFDVRMGNPNGDPDNENEPRMDMLSERGIVTNGCIKRKIRNYVDLVHGNQSPNRIFIRSEVALNTMLEEAYTENGLKIGKEKIERGKKEIARQWMCENYFDIRSFGAVLSTGNAPAGQVRGAIQVSDAWSMDRIYTVPMTITRIGITTEADFEKKESEMGRKSIIPYALYAAHVFYNPYLAEKSGFGQADLDLFWQALQNAWELDRSAARGSMAFRRGYLFQHSSKLGNARANELFDLIDVQRDFDGEFPAGWEDYQISVDDGDLPDGIELIVV